MKVVLASGNPGKLRELAELLAPSGLAVLPQSAFGIETPPETGATFRDNALLKARHAAALTGLPSVVLPGFLARAVMRGQGVHIGGREQEGWVRLYDDSGVFLGIGWSVGAGEIHPKRLWIGAPGHVEPMGARG